MLNINESIDKMILNERNIVLLRLQHATKESLPFSLSSICLEKNNMIPDDTIVFMGTENTYIHNFMTGVTKIIDNGSLMPFGDEPKLSL